MSKILVPLDFSDLTPRVVDVAGKMAQATGGQVVLVHVHPPEPPFVAYEAVPVGTPFHPEVDIAGELAHLERWQAHLVAQGLETTVLHMQGPPGEQILAAADEVQAGMIVMGSHGHGAVYDLVVGSVAHAVMHRARCPVTVVPPANRG